MGQGVNPDELAVSAGVGLPRDDEWYPRECEFCTRDAALACPDTLCRATKRGENRTEE